MKNPPTYDRPCKIAEWTRIEREFRWENLYNLSGWPLFKSNKRRLHC